MQERLEAVVEQVTRHNQNRQWVRLATMGVGGVHWCFRWCLWSGLAGDQRWAAVFGLSLNSADRLAGEKYSTYVPGQDRLPGGTSVLLMGESG